MFPRRGRESSAAAASPRPRRVPGTGEGPRGGGIRRGRCLPSVGRPVHAAGVLDRVERQPDTPVAGRVGMRQQAGLSLDYRDWTTDDRCLGITLARLQAEGHLLHRKPVRFARLTVTTSPTRVPRAAGAKISAFERPPGYGGFERGQPGTGVPLARQATDDRQRRGCAGDHVGGSHHARDPPTRAGQQHPGRAVRPPPSGRGPCAHRRGCRSRGGLGADPRIVRTMSGLRRTGLLARRLPHRVCSRCRVGGNRDHVAAVNLAKRALLGKRSHQAAWAVARGPGR
jgi:hypothetical protein